MVDLYYALYGSKRPLCLQSAEMNNMYKDFVREGSMKKSSTIVTSTPTPEVKPEITKTEDTDIVLEQTPPVNTLKRTATEAFVVDDDIIKIENHEEVTVANEAIKDEIYDGDDNQMVDKTSVVDTAPAIEADSFGSESKKLKSELFDEDENSITIIDVSESTVTRMDSSFDSAKADNDMKHKLEGPSKVSNNFLLLCISGRLSIIKINLSSYRKRKRRTKRNTNISISTNIIRKRIRIKNAIAKIKKIPIFHGFKLRKLHRKL